MRRSLRSLRRRLAYAVVMLVIAGSALVLPSQAAYAGESPGSAETITSLPFYTGEGEDLSNPGPSTGVDNDKVAAGCNGGAPIYRARWYRYTPSTKTTIVMRGEYYTISTGGGGPYWVGGGLAILTSGRDVIDCNPSGMAGPVKLDPGQSVYLVQFSQVSNGGYCGDVYCDGVERSMNVRATTGYLLGDNWASATPITSVPFSQTVDTTLTTDEPEDSHGLGCPDPDGVSDSVWWMLTPTTTGAIHFGTTGAPALGQGYSELTPNGPVQDYSCDYEPTLKAGHTYLLEAGFPLKDGYGGSDPNGRLTLSVTSAPALGKPDLVVTKVVSTPASPKAGDPVSFRATIKNQGTAPTQGGVAHGVAFRVDGATKTWSDTFNASLWPGQSVTVTGNGGPAGAATWPATVGSHTVTAIVDDVNRIRDEVSESNNTRTAPLTVAAGPGRPDLVVTGVTWTPTNPAAGTPVTFKATIKNSGTAATPVGIIHGAAFRVDGATKAWSDTNKTSLAPGASTTLTATGGPSGKATWPATTGPHAVTAIVDDVNRIPGEADEANNTLVVPLTIGASPSRPDVVVTGVSWAPTSPAAGAPVKLTATVKNIGTRSTPNGTVVGVSFQPNAKTTEASYSDTFKGPLHPGQTITLTANGGATWNPPAGSTPLVAVVDDTNRFTESNEANNTLRTTLTTG